MLKFLQIGERPELCKNIKQLYQEAFPKNEQVPFFFLRYKAKTKLADFYGIFDDNLFVGLLYEVYFQEIVFVFYLAIDAAQRNKGYGSAVLEEIKRRNAGKRLILNIEEVNKNGAGWEEKARRKQFYLKNGFQEAGFKTCEKQVSYEMLCYGGTVRYEEYASLMKRYMGKVLYAMYYKGLSR